MAPTCGATADPQESGERAKVMERICDLTQKLVPLRKAAQFSVAVELSDDEVSDGEEDEDEGDHQRRRFDETPETVASLAEQCHSIGLYLDVSVFEMMGMERQNQLLLKDNDFDVLLPCIGGKDIIAGRFCIAGLGGDGDVKARAHMQRDIFVQLLTSMLDPPKQEEVSITFMRKIRTEYLFRPPGGQ